MVNSFYFSGLLLVLYVQTSAQPAVSSTDISFFIVGSLSLFGILDDIQKSKNKKCNTDEYGPGDNRYLGDFGFILWWYHATPPYADDTCVSFDVPVFLGRFITCLYWKLKFLQVGECKAKDENQVNVELQDCSGLFSNVPSCRTNLFDNLNRMADTRLVLSKRYFGVNITDLL